MQHGGLQDAFGRWHQPAARAYRDIARELYQIADIGR